MIRSAALSSRGGNWARTVERTIALVRARFLPRRRDMFSGILNLFRPQVTAGKCFSFRSLVHDANQPTGSVFHALSLSPIPFVAAAHESNVAKVLCHERQTACKG